MVKLEGTYTALITPFSSTDGNPIDWNAFDALLDHQLKGHVTGLVPCGTTGESPTLSHEEHQAVIQRTVAHTKGKVQVIAGTGSNSTREAIELSRAAEEMGVDAVMVVVPYYNKPTQEGLFRHFVAVAKSVECPVVIYNIPGRSVVDLSADTMSRILEAAPNVIATKEATGNVLRAQELSRRHGDRLAILSGDDALTLPMIAVGARGVISVTSNLLPGPVAEATRLALSSDLASARKAHLALMPVHEAMFVESNPAPVKAALARAKIGSDVVRPPLAPLSENARKVVFAIVDKYEGKA